MDKPLRELLNEEFGPEEAAARIERLRTELSFDVLSPLFESSQAFRARVGSAIQGVVTQHPGQRVAVITHAPVIMAFVADTLGSPHDFAMNPKLTSITRVLARDGRRTIDYVNATPHLDER